MTKSYLAWPSPSRAWRGSLGALVLALAAALGCNESSPASTAVARIQQTHSASLIANPDHTRLYVTHPDADSVSILDPVGRAVVAETLLAPARPAFGANGRFEPAVAPRAVALSSTGRTLYVTGQRSGQLYALDAGSGALQGSVVVCSEPVGVLVSADDTHVFVACSQDDQVVDVDAASLKVVTAAPCPRKPWALAWSGDGQTLIATHFLGPGLSTFATEPLALLATYLIADGPPSVDPTTGEPISGEDPTQPHGKVRGIYDAALRPGTSELWVLHMMLGTDTAQPDLVFNNTVFPAVSILDLAASGEQIARLSVQATPGDSGAFGDVVSGPRAIAFSEDGTLAFIANADSEDVLAVDTVQRIEAQIARPLPGHLPEGVVWAGGELFVQERNTEDVATFAVARAAGVVSLSSAGPAFSTLATDPMPANLRLGQKLFYSANSDDVPTTQNHWVACASCHLEGRSDAVTWFFAQGPRDTPSNAGGLLDTGFLFRTADRRQVQDYWRTINVEQGGHFSNVVPSQQPLLNAMAAYVNAAIPTPVPPSTDESHTLSGQELANLRAHGQSVFAKLGCASCHAGPAFTDSGSGNPTLDLTGPIVATSTPGGILLHDVGTCVTDGEHPDVEHTDVNGDERDGCAFDTPQLRGLADSAPYLHDGSAATLSDAVTVMLRALAPAGSPQPPLNDDDRHALIEFLRGL